MGLFLAQSVEHLKLGSTSIGVGRHDGNIDDRWSDEIFFPWEFGIEDGFKCFESSSFGKSIENAVQDS